MSHLNSVLTTVILMPIFAVAIESSRGTKDAVRPESVTPNSALLPQNGVQPPIPTNPRPPNPMLSVSPLPSVTMSPPVAPPSRIRPTEPRSAREEVTTQVAVKRAPSGVRLASNQQTFRQSDVEISRRIQQELLADESISPYAQNIKVITVDGKVMLKGSVRSENDEKIILRVARNVAGLENVLNRLEIVPVRKEL